MSDGLTEAYRNAAIYEDYVKRLHAIRTMSLEDLCNFYNIEKSSDVMELMMQVDKAYFEIDNRDYMAYGDFCPRYKLQFVIPDAYQSTESFANHNLEEVVTRAKAYLTWASTDLGKQAIKRYLE